MTIQEFEIEKSGVDTNVIGNYLKLSGFIAVYALFPFALSPISPILSSILSIAVYYGMGLVLLISAYWPEIGALRKQTEATLAVLNMESDSDIFMQSAE